jgi:glycosyltransferase involved in cell wall biosynthesis
MKIGLLLPSALMYEPLSDGKIFAPKDLFVHLANGLARRGHRVRVYSAPDEMFNGVDVISGEIGYIVAEPYLMKLRYVGDKNRRMLTRVYARTEYELDLTSRAYKDAQLGKVEVIHSFLEFTAHYFAEATGIPTVYTIHDPLPDHKYLDYWRYKRFPKDRYVAISASQKEQLGSAIEVNDVVRNAIAVENFSLSTDPGVYLLFAGRYMPEKGVHDAVQVGEKTGIQTLLAGSKEYKELDYYQKVVEPFVKRGKATEIGYLDLRHKKGLYQGAKALLFPIHWEEAFGMVLIESMASGTPVVAYNRGSVSEIVVDGVTGFIVDPPVEDEEGLPERVKKALGSHLIRKRGVEGLVEAVGRISEISRAACRKHVEEKFSVDQMVEGYERVYEKAARGL